MREYVEKTLHTRVDCEPVDASGLPLYLRGLYSLERWTAFGVPFAVASPVESPTVKTMAKHRDALEAALGTPVAFALEGATGYRVGRMLEAGLPFIAPDKQVYLPFLGIALSSGRSHARDRRQTDVGTFSPQAQRLALMALYGDLDGASVTQAAGLLGAAKMTASRAFDELAAADPSIVAAEGRRRVLRPGRDKMAMWRRLEPRMSSPVAREHRLGRVPDAEERALELAADARDTGLDEPEDPACVVQVLRYEPVPAPGCAVDPLSAVLSLPADERDDPRVAGEIENVLTRVLGGDHEGNR